MCRVGKEFCRERNLWKQKWIGNDIHHLESQLGTDIKNSKRVLSINWDVSRHGFLLFV